jgi:hypothetical protein
VAVGVDAEVLLEQVVLAVVVQVVTAQALVANHLAVVQVLNLRCQ